MENMLWIVRVHNDPAAIPSQRKRKSILFYLRYYFMMIRVGKFSQCILRSKIRVRRKKCGYFIPPNYDRATHFLQYILAHHSVSWCCLGPLIYREKKQLITEKKKKFRVRLWGCQVVLHVPERKTSHPDLLFVAQCGGRGVTWDPPH